MREPFLDNASYQSMLKFRQEQVVPKLTNNIRLKDVDASALANVKYRIFGNLRDIAILNYSGNAALAVVQSDVQRAIDAFEQHIEDDEASLANVNLAIQETYVEALWLLSLTKLLGLGDAQIERVANFYAADETNDGADELFGTLLSKLGRKSFPDEGLIHEDLYRVLLDCINAEPTERPALMTQFLKRWFKGQKECDWWGSHVPRKGMTVLDTGFFGYWAFEAALVTFLWDIDDTSYRDLPHYPKDLADHARQAVLIGGGAGHPIRVAAGASCPRSGFWFTPARLDSRRRFEQGQTMPQVGGDYGATIWQWDEQQ